MITYLEALEKPETFRALTGIDEDEFEQLLRDFEAAYHRDVEEKKKKSFVPGNLVVDVKLAFL